MSNQPFLAPDGTHGDSHVVSRRKRLFMIIIGSMIASFGLDMFLVPNGFIAGGLTGISALAYQVTGLQTGMFLFLFNLPLVIFLFLQANRDLALRAAAGLTVFSICSLLLHPLPPLIEGGAAAAGLGGIFLGLGIGIGIKHGAVLDMLLHMPKIPPPIMAIINSMRLSGAGIVINVLILSLAGLLLGLEQAMYSAIACLMALEAARLTTSGYSLKREVTIHSSHTQEIRNCMEMLLGRKPLPLHMTEGVDIHPDQQHDQLLYQIHLMELTRLKSLVRTIDPEASISVSPYRRK
ncbi:YitT family protein [Paenibacillus sp. N3/727]|uniref:YitT family protein n=1 Tax=Paenibacillus sp. N3/727 TaxID=2925845 RepID=UPI001F52CCFE|nr:YitT family protein [Paenibacillus sp. N3/727]UNK19938.1 YitT family protein [Paenibacillus sp. N3/727]